MAIEFTIPRFLVQGNFASVITCLLLIVFLFTNVSFTKKVNRRFISIIFCCLLLTVSDNIRYLTFLQTEPGIWRYLSAAAGYTLRPIIIFLFVTIAVRRSKTKIGFFPTIPLYINGLLAFISCIPPYCGIMFDFSTQNVFIRGPFGMFPYFCCALYVILLLYFIIKKNAVPQSEQFIVFFVIFLGAIATAMESLLKFDLILSQVLIIGTVFYYLFFNVQIYKRDTLTMLEDRRSFYLSLDKLKAKTFCIVSMDLNNLKLYNDTYGHAAGDEALVTAAEVMISSFPKKCKLYRTGGDEFMAVCKGYSLDHTKMIIEKFQKNLSVTPYSVACGTALYTPGDDIDDVIAASDKLMYKNKKLLKEKAKSDLL